MSALRGGVGIRAGTCASPLRLKFLVDNALPPGLADLLRDAGHDAVHVRNYGMQAAKDEQTAARAVHEDRIIMSADSDFSTILAVQEAERPSFILFREPDLMIAADYFDLMAPALPILEPELAAGCVAVFSRVLKSAQNRRKLGCKLLILCQRNRRKLSFSAAC
jgi:predicted nuclease of predicted toxin-antitoxin system